MKTWVFQFHELFLKIKIPEIVQFIKYVRFHEIFVMKLHIPIFSIAGFIVIIITSRSRCRRRHLQVPKVLPTSDGSSNSEDSTSSSASDSSSTDTDTDLRWPRHKPNSSWPFNPELNNWPAALP